MAEVVRNRAIDIPLTDAEYAEFVGLVKLHDTNPEFFAHLAIISFLDWIEGGGVPLIKPSTVENATRITVLGRELPDLD